MKKTGIFYGSSTGVTAEVAEEIAKLLDVPSADVHDVAKSAPSDVEPYDVLILGS
ncbi:MAG: flavodoxin domain-containing protein, partial [Muribaculum sp.]